MQCYVIFRNCLQLKFAGKHSSTKCMYSRTPLIRPPSESHWCGHIRGMVACEGFIYLGPMKIIHLRHIRNICVYCINA